MLQAGTKPNCSGPRGTRHETAARGMGQPEGSGLSADTRGSAGEGAKRHNELQSTAVSWDQRESSKTSSGARTFWHTVRLESRERLLLTSSSYRFDNCLRTCSQVGTRGTAKGQESVWGSFWLEVGEGERAASGLAVTAQSA